MNKAQLIQRIATSLEQSQTSTKPVVEQILQQIHIALSEVKKSSCHNLAPSNYVIIYLNRVETRKLARRLRLQALTSQALRPR